MGSRPILQNIVLLALESCQMTRSQVMGWNPLEGFTKSSCRKLKLGGTLPASNSRKG
jgi:hypothetical protein